MIFNAQNETVVLSVTATTGSIALPEGKNSIRVVNGGANECFFALGGSAVSATLPTGTPSTTSTPLLSGSDAVFSYNNRVHSHIAAICNASESTTLYITCGSGA